MFTVYIIDDRYPDYDIERSVLEPAGALVKTTKRCDQESIARDCADADAILVNLARIGDEALSGLPRCRVVSRYGLGLDNIDLAACARRGIAVRNVRSYCDDEVAEHALALIMDLARSLSARDRSVRAGTWGKELPARRLAGQSLGIVGFGGTARALIRKMLGMGLTRILVYSPTISQDKLEAVLGEPLLAFARDSGLAIQATALDDLVSRSDIVSLHASLNDSSRSLIGAREIALMRKDAFLINVARGALVDEDALVAALREGRIAGAGLDVFVGEPLPGSSPLRGMDNVVLSDHAAYYSHTSIAELKRRAAENLLGYAGKM